MTRKRILLLAAGAFLLAISGWIIRDIQTTPREPYEYGMKP